MYLKYQTTQTACTVRIDRNLQRHREVFLRRHGFLVVILAPFSNVQTYSFACLLTCLMSRRKAMARMASFIEQSRKTDGCLCL